MVWEDLKETVWESGGVALPQVRAALGHLSVETAKRPRICSRHRSGKEKHEILAGERCLVVRGAGGASQNYCIDAAGEILRKAGDDLVDLRNALRL
jgi:hypothetical protein